jgi:hypothetical protein
MITPRRGMKSGKSTAGKNRNKKNADPYENRKAIRMLSEMKLNQNISLEGARSKPPRQFIS